MGKILQTWHRVEDQSRGALHVHMAIWIDVEGRSADASAAAINSGITAKLPKITAAAGTQHQAAEVCGREAYVMLLHMK